MMRGISRRFFVTSAGAAALGAALGKAGPAQARAPERSLRPVGRGDDFLRSIQPSIEDLIARARLNGEVSCCVARTDTGDVLESHAGDRALPPASVAKALTAGYALAQLGPAHRFETRILATGGIMDGVVRGDLILAGGGDPTLDTDGLAKLAEAVASAGITAVNGGFKVWGGALPFVHGIDAAQPDHVGYNPAVSGVNLNYNRVHFEWRQAGAGYTVTMDARSEAHRPAVRMARMAVEPRSLPIYTYADAGGRDNWTVAKNALGKGGARWLPVRKPELYAGEVFQSFAKARGVTLGGPEVIEALPGEVAQVAQLASAPLDEILRDMLKWSTNLTAEAVGMAASRKRLGQAPVSLEQSAAAMNAWAAAELGVAGLKLVDHSGLGDSSRVTASDMMAALVALHRKGALKPLLKQFPMRDANRKIIKDHPIHVAAKTGTLNFVSGLAGFVDLPDGTELVFAIFAADLERRAGLSRAERENPEGARGWNRRAKALQQALIERWGVVYAA